MLISFNPYRLNIALKSRAKRKLASFGKERQKAEGSQSVVGVDDAEWVDQVDQVEISDKAKSLMKAKPAVWSLPRAVEQDNDRQPANGVDKIV